MHLIRQVFLEAKFRDKNTYVLICALYPFCSCSEYDWPRQSKSEGPKYDLQSSPAPFKTTLYKLNHNFVIKNKDGNRKKTEGAEYEKNCILYEHKYTQIDFSRLNRISPPSLLFSMFQF